MTTIKITTIKITRTKTTTTKATTANITTTKTSTMKATTRKYYFCYCCKHGAFMWSSVCKKYILAYARILSIFLTQPGFCLFLKRGPLCLVMSSPRHEAVVRIKKLKGSCGLVQGCSPFEGLSH